MNKLAVLVVDMQEYFFKFSKIYGILEHDYMPIIEPTKRIIETARSLQIPVIYTVAIMERYTAPKFSKIRESGVKPSDTELAIIRGLRPQPNDYIIAKCRYNSFVATQLLILLKNLDVEKLILTGITTEVCVESTARGAIDHDFRVVVVEDCTATSSEEVKRISLKNMANLGRGVQISHSSNVLVDMMNIGMAKAIA